MNGFADSVQTDGKGFVVSLAAGRLLDVLSDVTDTLDSVETAAQQIGEEPTERVDMLNEQLDTLQTQAVEVEGVIEKTKTDIAG